MAFVRNRSLCERLRNPGSPSEVAGVFDRYEAWASIQENLGNIFSSRQGLAPAQLDLGLPDMGIDSSLRDTVSVMREAIRVNVEKYEPRLRDVNVFPVDEQGTDGRPALLIEAVHVDDPDEQYINIIVVFSEDGKIQLDYA